MSDRNYWINLFTGTTWQEFVGAGAKVTGFRESRWSTVQRIGIGDYLLCYVTGISRLIGILEVSGRAFKDESEIWNVATFSSRLPVKPLIMLTFETAVPILTMRDTLSIFQNLKNPNAWNGKVRGSPTQWTRADGEAVVHAIREAERNPIQRSVDAKKLARRPGGISTPSGQVAVPDDDEPAATTSDQPAEIETTAHTEMQYLLLRLGIDMGFDVWVARNDRNRLRNGKPLSELLRLKAALPLQFGDTVNKTIELIDVLWLKSNAIVAAFEIESTTLID